MVENWQGSSIKLCTNYADYYCEYLNSENYFQIKNFNGMQKTKNKFKIIFMNPEITQLISKTGLEFTNTYHFLKLTSYRITIFKSHSAISSLTNRVSTIWQFPKALVWQTKLSRSWWNTGAGNKKPVGSVFLRFNTLNSKQQYFLFKKSLESNVL